MTESRLREAGLFRIPNLNGAINYMSRVGITVTHDGALLIVAFSKSGDEMTSLRMSWESITFDDEDMRETLAMIIDNFVVEYQRANESACERRENQR